MQKTTLALSIASVLTAVSAQAYDAGDWIVRAGIASVNPNEESSALALNGTELSQLGLGLPRSTATVDSNEQIGLTITKMLTSNWGIELLAATPFSHDIHAEGLGLDAAEVKHLPPTLSVQYYFADSSSAFQPYVGLGLNYTIFFDEEVDSELNNALIGLGATGNTELELDSSLGYALEAGFDYALNENWVFNTSLWYIDIDTTAEFKTPGLGSIKADVEIDPWVFMASVGYKF